MRCGKKTKMKKFVLYNILFLITLASFAQPKPIKNVILMIPDGTATGVLSAARWYQYYLDSTKTALNIDPYIRGLVRTNSSDAPIGDSAPTTSCYVSGQPSQTGFISTYPRKTDHDLFPIDATRAYQPQATVLEAAKQLQHKSTGLVFTCEFPHATPADCSAHTYNRGNYGMIAPQMVYNKVDVVIGGGASYLNETEQSFLKNNGYQVFLNDISSMRKCNKAPFWALYGKASMAYDMERDTAVEPSLAEMTKKAIQTLSQNPNGFFLMVEGSKVDWAAHDNDAKPAITDFLAFDRACAAAIDFAKKNGETVVVILPDHGTGALTIGDARSNSGYDRLSLKQIMQPIDNYKLSVWTMAEKLKAVDTTAWPALFEQNFGFAPSAQEISYLQTAHDYEKSSISAEQRRNNLGLSKMLGQFLYGRTYFGFTTFGHTGENVFFAMYNPNNDVLSGCPTNIQINQYLCRQMNLTDSLPKLTDNIYADHHQVFANYQTRIDSLGPNSYRLIVKNKKKTLIAESYTNYILINNQKIDLSSVIVYMPINKTFYLPKELYRYLEK